MRYLKCSYNEENSLVLYLSSNLHVHVHVHVLVRVVSVTFISDLTQV